MLQSLNQLLGNKLGATDGQLGHVKDFYFDDENWAVRYIVADTGNWLSGRLVLLSPHAFGSFYKDGDYLLVDLTRQQIEKSPGIDSHQPVSRQFEEEYFRYYGWSSYWGVGGFPMMPQPLPSVDEQEMLSSKNDDPHLRSTQEVIGYRIQTEDGEIGQVSDFVVDDQNWNIHSVIVETGHWYSGKEIAIEPRHIKRISYEDSTVFVDLTKVAIQDAPDYHVPTLSEPRKRHVEARSSD